MDIKDILHDFEKFPAECAARLVEIIKAGDIKNNLLELVKCVASLVGWLATVIDGEERPVIGEDPQVKRAILDICDAAEFEVSSEGMFGPEFFRALLAGALVKVLDGILENINTETGSEIGDAIMELIRVVLFHLSAIIEDIQDNAA